MSVDLRLRCVFRFLYHFILTATHFLKQWSGGAVTFVEPGVGVEAVVPVTGSLNTHKEQNREGEYMMFSQLHLKMFVKLKVHVTSWTC